MTLAQRTPRDAYIRDATLTIDELVGSKYGGVGENAPFYGNAHRSLTRKWLYAVRVFVAGVVYMGADGVESHLLAREGAHMLLDVGPLIGHRIQP